MLMRFACWLVLSLVTVMAQAAAPVLRDMAFLEDRDGRETIETIASMEPARFTPLAGHTFAGGYSRSVHWLRMTLDAPAGEAWLEGQPPNIDDLRLYVPDPQRPGKFLEQRQGDTLVFASRTFDYRGFLFRVQLPRTGQHTLYLRIETTSSSLLLLRAWAPGELWSTANAEYALHAGSIVLILGVLLRGLGTAFWVRDALTAWFLTYLLLLAALFAGSAGLLHQYVYPGSAVANNVVVSFVSIAVIAAGYAFYGKLFLVGRDQPVLFWIYRTAFWVSMMGLLPAALGFYTETMQVLTATVLPMTLLGFALSVRLWRRRIPGGGMMLLANLSSLTGLAAFILFLRGEVGGEIVMLHSLQISSFGTILALEIAVSVRYLALRDGRLKADRDAQNERVRREQQGQFLAMLAHELRTSLSVLKMALARQPMSEKSVAKAGRAMESMGSVIERSIQVEQLTEGSLVLEQLPCDVGQMLAAVVADSTAPARFVLNLEHNTILKTDAKLLRVILSNLVDNATKYAAPDTPIEVSLGGVDGLDLRIANVVGPAGVPDAQKVFDKFYRAPQAHSLTGSGLGLHISYALAQRLGGHLSFEPGMARLAFALHLPLALGPSQGNRAGERF